MREIIELFIIFFQIGGFTFGGGYAMLPIIQEEIVQKRNWATDEEVIDYYAIGQCTPGIIAVNTATFIGYKRKGVLGAIVATLGLVTPSLIIITTIAKFFKHFQEYKMVQYALGGIQVVVVALIMNSVSNMFKQAVKDWLGVLLFIVSFLIIAFLHLSPIAIIIPSAIIGILRWRNVESKE